MIDSSHLNALKLCSQKIQLMAKKITCPCGWTLTSPLGDEDIKKHTMIHARETHPGEVHTEEDIVKSIETV